MVDRQSKLRKEKVPREEVEMKQSNLTPKVSSLAFLFLIK